LVPAFVWDPLTLYRTTAKLCCDNETQQVQAPCPKGGWKCHTICKTWSYRYVHGEKRHFWAYGRVHQCKDCHCTFRSWNPDSMKHWPLFVRHRLDGEIHFGRKSALERSLAQRALREAPLGLEMEHFAEEVNERKVLHWRRMQTIYESWLVFNAQHPTAATMIQQQEEVQEWPAFDSDDFGGRMLTVRKRSLRSVSPP
jgi:hypothetical protein